MWFSLLEHLFFCDFISSSNIYIYYIHFSSDYLTSTTTFQFEVDAFSLKTSFASLQNLESLSSCVHSNHRYDMLMIHSFKF